VSGRQGGAGREVLSISVPLMSTSHAPTPLASHSPLELFHEWEPGHGHRLRCPPSWLASILLCIYTASTPPRHSWPRQHTDRLNTAGDARPALLGWGFVLRVFIALEEIELTPGVVSMSRQADRISTSECQCGQHRTDQAAHSVPISSILNGPLNQVKFRQNGRLYYQRWIHTYPYPCDAVR